MIERLDIKTGKMVKAYDHAESVNLAARIMCLSTSEFGVFCMGYMCGMAAADVKFERSPRVNDEELDEKTTFSCIALGCAVIEDEYTRTKRSCVTLEVNKGIVFVKGKEKNAEIMISAGKEIQQKLNEWTTKEVDSRVGEYEKTMVAGLKSQKEEDGAEEKTGPENRK